jgi:hypothetical protein
MYTPPIYHLSAIYCQRFVRRKVLKKNSRLNDQFSTLYKGTGSTKVLAENIFLVVLDILKISMSPGAYHKQYINKSIEYLFTINMFPSSFMSFTHPFPPICGSRKGCALRSVLCGSVDLYFGYY